MTTNIPKEQGHTLKQTMLNTLLLNLKTTVPRLQKEHQKHFNCSKNNIRIAPNQHQNCSINQHLYNIKPAKNSTKTEAETQHLYNIKPAKSSTKTAAANQHLYNIKTSKTSTKTAAKNHHNPSSYFVISNSPCIIIIIS